MDRSSHPTEALSLDGYEARPRFSSVRARWVWDLIGPAGNNLTSADTLEEAEHVAAVHAAGPK